MDRRRRLARMAGYAALTGALISTVADTLLLYHPEGGYFDGTYEFLADFSRERMLWGHYLGVLALPMHAAGIYLVYLALRKAGRNLATFAALLGTYLTFLGVAYHGAVYPLWLAAQQGQTNVQALLPFSEPLGLIFAGTFLLLMLGLAVMVLRGQTHLARWVGFTTPAFTYPIWIALMFLVPPLGNFLAPMGFNLSMAIFFAAMLWDGGWKQGIVE